MLQGCAVSGGFAVGKILIIGENKHTLGNTYLGQKEENERFETALGEVTTKTKEVCARIRSIIGKSEADIFQGHICLAQDPEVQKEVKEKIARGFNAETAAESVFNRHIEHFLAAPHEWTRQRAADIRDIKHSFLSALCDEPQKKTVIPAGSVVAARELTPSAVSFLDRRRTAAVLTGEGGYSAHLAILLRAMGIPAVFSLKGLMDRVRDGQKVLVDGDKGEVYFI